MSQVPSILEVDPTWRRGIEDMGSKPKFWFRYQNEMWLFKQARPNTGEHWAEKVASEIAELLGLPTHEVQIARYEGRIGCAVKFFLKKNEILVHGNELLGGAIKGYDKDKQRGQADHNFSNIVETIEKWFPGKFRKSASLNLVGYFVFDALVGNTDRHHENWGMLLKPVKVPAADRQTGEQMRFKVALAPTFDHGSSLGRELLDERVQFLLAEPKGVQRYIRKATTGGIFENGQARKGLAPMALVELIAVTYPRLVMPWRNRIAALPEDFAVPLLAGVPESCMSQASRDFVLAFLSESRKMITSIL